MAWSTFVTLIAGAGMIAVIGALLYWLLIASEGVYLGRRVVVWLYDVYASRYDNIKNYDPEWEARALSGPFLAELEAVQAPLVLDVATGTARLTVALFASKTFSGRVIGVDASAQMLRIAKSKLMPHRNWALLQQSALQLAFPENTFDAVTCLEALEFFPDADIALRECIRVLKPGGLLLVTNRKGTRAMPGRVIPTRRFCAHLAAHFDVENVRAEIWQVDYDQVWAHKVTPRA